MSVSLKRSLSSAERAVSPPAIRKKRRSCSALSASTPKSHTIKIYSWNVNSIRPLLQKQLDFTGSQPFPLRSFLKDHGWPHLLCLQEVKVSSADTATQRLIEHAANAGILDGEPTYTTYFSLPRDKYNAIGFGGRVHGVATLIRDDILADKIVTTRPEWDLEGRVLIHDMVDRKLVVVNGYWVNGTSNIYRNPDTGVVQGTRHDHKLRFHQHVLDLCLTTESRANSVVLVGDMNVAPSRIDGHPNLRVSPVQHVKNRADFNAKFFEDSNGLQGIDVFRHLHGEEKRYTYHGRRRPWGENCDRVDLIIASRKLIETGSVIATDIRDNPVARGHSDHVPLWVSIDLDKVPGSQTAPGDPP